MKNLKNYVFATIMLISTIGMANDTKLTKENIQTKTPAEIEARLQVLSERVKEIQAIDFQNIEKVEKKKLKKELKEIKKEMGLDSRFSISIGAAIIIVLLLIIIL